MKKTKTVRKTNKPAQSLLIRPQQGFQELFLSSEADIVIGGGAAGAGKSYALLLEAARHADNPGFGAVIFRRTAPQVRNEGGLWDTAGQIYPLLGAYPRESTMEWRFPSGASVRFSHLQYDKNMYDHQGSQYPFIGFDELTHFSERQFFYLLSRNRSLCGVRPYVRATCNPDPDSWVARLIQWWIDPDTGLPIPERAGQLRYFSRDGDTMVWGDSRQEVVDRCPHLFVGAAADPLTLVKSLTFVPGSIYHNRLLLKADPAYLANLMSQDETTRAALLEGNWKARPDDNSLFPARNVEDLFSNYPEPDPFRGITCDAARFGRDLAVVASWQGWEVVRLQIFSRCSITELQEAIESERRRLGIPRSQVLIDQDGVGGGLVDAGGYMGFSGGATALNRENYFNLKTQCYYKLAEQVQSAQCAVRENFIVDGQPSRTISRGSKSIAVTDLLKSELRSIKRLPADNDRKLRINSKEQQKNLLGGRSPDLADTLMLRAWFGLQVKKGVSW